MAVIAISRGTFSGGQKLAECVAEKLGYRCLSRAVAHEAALRYGVSEEKLIKAMEEAPGSGLLGRAGVETTSYLSCARSTLVREAKDDNIVYHGLAEHFLLEKVPGVLRIRVIANTEFRIKGAMERHNVGRDEAIRLIKKSDEQRVKWTKFLYHLDWADPLFYDLLMNLDHIDLDDACEVVCCTAGLPRFTRTPEDQKIIDDLALSTEVKATIDATSGVVSSGVEVEADGGVITLKGQAVTQENVEAIQKLAGGVPGVREIKSNMEVKSRR